MRTNILETLYFLIDRTDVEINDILENCNLSCDQTLCFLSRHVDNLKDAICMLEKMGEEDLYMKLRGVMCSSEAHHDVVKEVIDKPVIMKKS